MIVVGLAATRRRRRRAPGPRARAGGGGVSADSVTSCVFGTHPFVAGRAARRLAAGPRPRTPPPCAVGRSAGVAARSAVAGDGIRRRCSRVGLSRPSAGCVVGQSDRADRSTGAADRRRRRAPRHRPGQPLDALLEHGRRRRDLVRAAARRAARPAPAATRSVAEGSRLGCRRRRSTATGSATARSSWCRAPTSSPVVSPALVADCRSLGVRRASTSRTAAMSRPTRRPGLSLPRHRADPAPPADRVRRRVERPSRSCTLVERARGAIPDASIVLVGAVSVPLPAAPNVHVLGAGPYDELPGPPPAADVGIIPYRPEPVQRRQLPAQALRVPRRRPARRRVGRRRRDRSATPTSVRRRDDADGVRCCRRRCAGRPRPAGDVHRRWPPDHSWDARADALLDALDAADGRGRTR